MSGSRGSWRLAARLASREVRHRPVRAALVVALIIVPVFLLSIADVLIESNQTMTAEQRFRREYGAVDATFEYEGVASTTFVPALPEASRTTRFRFADLPLTPRKSVGQRLVNVRDVGKGLGPTDLELTTGRAAGPGEMVVSRGVAHWLRAAVGDTVRFDRPEFAARISGIVRSRADFNRPILSAPAFPFAIVVQPGLVRTRVGVDLPPGWSAIRTYRDSLQSPAEGGARVWLRPPAGRARPVSVQSADGSELFNVSPVTPSQFDDRVITTQAKVWTWVGVVLVLAMVSVLIAAAFATTARRQLVTLGQLAANGGDQQFLRRMLTLQGTLLGIVGATVGVGGALAVLALLHGWIEHVFRHTVPYVVGWDLVILGVTAVTAATFAARFPARSTSQVPVLAALAGRRPLPPVTRLQTLRAVIVFGTGVGLLIMVATSSSGRGIGPQVAAAVGIVGGVFVMAGVAFMTPIVVTLFGSAVGRLGPSPRIAGRGLVRVRSRSAAIVTAVTIAGTLAITVVTGMLGLGVNRDIPEFVSLPKNQLLIEDNAIRYGIPIGNGPPQATADDFAAKQRDVARVVPGIEFQAVRGVVAESVVGPGVAANDGPNRVDPYPATVLAIDGAAARSLLHLDDGTIGVLERSGGVLVNSSSVTPSSSGRAVTATLRVGESAPFVVPVVGTPNVVGSTGIGGIITRARAAELGVNPTIVSSLGTAPKPIDSGQRNTLDSGASDPYQAPLVVGPGSGASLQVTTGQDVAALNFWRGIWSPWRLQAWIAGAALLFVLTVVAIGLLLGSTENRDEQSVLERLGVRPRTGRRMEATKAALLAFCGGLLAVPAGFVPMALIFRAVQEPSRVGTFFGESALVPYPRIVFPWITAIGVIVAIPVIAALGAWSASLVAQRTRAFRGTLAFDAD